MGNDHSLAARVKSAVDGITDPDELVRKTVQEIHESSKQNDWTGIYLIDGEELFLHSFLGAPSPHVRIPIGSGICGAAASAEKTIIVPDVKKDPRYLACSLETRSEIVVPIFRDGKVVGEIDIDSHTLDAFGSEDRESLEEVARFIAARLPENHKEGKNQ